MNTFFGKSNWFIGQISLILLLTSCSDILEPVTDQVKPNEPSAFATVGELQALVYDVYGRMKHVDYYASSYVLSSEVATDNAFSNGNSGRYIQESRLEQLPSWKDLWFRIYRVIARCNLAISTTSDKKFDDVRGQAYAIRALAYFDLLRRFGQEYVTDGVKPGGVPVVLTFSDESNFFPSRLTLADVKKQIESDLDNAEKLIDPAITAKTRINKSAVNALNSRYYLHTKQWSKAKAAAKKVIDTKRYQLSSKDAYLSDWKKNGAAGSIFELGIAEAEALSNSHIAFLLLKTAYGDVQPTNELYDLYGKDDVRKQAYSKEGDGYRLTGKYTDPKGTDHIILFRYAEVLLNYAEASFQLKDADALEKLNVVPKARGASLYTEANVDNILKERRKELALEGFRFWDLLRYEKNVVSYLDAKGDKKTTFNYGDYKFAYPIPTVELDSNPNIKQNKGYE